MKRVWAWLWPLLAIIPLMLLVGHFRAPDLPKRAPEFTLQTVDGAPLKLADYRGRTVLLNFWATWCRPCRMEMPSLADFARDNPEVAVIGLASDELDRVRAYVAENRTPYPNAIAPDALLAAYDIETYPTTVVINADGTVRRAYTGMAFGPHLWWLTR